MDWKPAIDPAPFPERVNTARGYARQAPRGLSARAPAVRRICVRVSPFSPDRYRPHGFRIAFPVVPVTSRFCGDIRAFPGVCILGIDFTSASAAVWYNRLVEYVW